MLTFFLNGKTFGPVYNKMWCREYKKLKPGSKAEKMYRNASQGAVLHMKPKTVYYFYRKIQQQQQEQQQQQQLIVNQILLPTYDC